MNITRGRIKQKQVCNQMRGFYRGYWKEGAVVCLKSVPWNSPEQVTKKAMEFLIHVSCFVRWYLGLHFPKPWPTRHRYSNRHCFIMLHTFNYWTQWYHFIAQCTCFLTEFLVIPDAICVSPNKFWSQRWIFVKSSHPSDLILISYNWQYQHEGCPNFKDNTNAT
jgi:hypothetical protein